MVSPFKFGRIVEGKYFTNRETEISRLFSNFENSINTTLISPRRWGKSSLVKAVINKFKNNKKIKICELDLLNVRNEKQFYSYYAKQIIKSTYNKPEELLKQIKSFFKRITPKLSMPINEIDKFDIAFEFKDITEDFEDILKLPERVAEKKDVKIIVSIDEFQNLSYFDNPKLFQQRLRSSWQRQNIPLTVSMAAKRT